MPGGDKGYGGAAKLLHWTSALLVLGLLAAGLWMTGLPFGRLKLVAYAWHKWIGLTVLALALVRIAWRLRTPPPALPAALAPWEKRLAPLGHWLLLVLVLAQPVCGWLMSSAGGVAVIWFGVLPLPDLVPRDQGLFAALRTLHAILAYALIGVIALHIAAVLRHDLLRRDGILRRMWF
jgi:cytochrome b561